MLLRFRSHGRRIVASTVLVLLAALLVSPSATQLRPTQFRAAAFHDEDEGRKLGLSRQQLIRDAIVWHDINVQRLQASAELRSEMLSLSELNQDINDISVLAGDPRAIIPANAFDLGNRTIQFTPFAGGYTITAGTGTFDNNLGTKLNLAASPAVNPKTDPGVEAGDDAYISQDLGFNFNYFGTFYSSVAITSNGNLVFRPSNISQATFDLSAVLSVASVGDFQSGLPRIAPYWHDLDARASVTTGAVGVYVRTAADRVVVTWNNIRDFPNDPAVDRGVHRFQATLFNTGRIVFTYDTAQLTSQALAGITPGGSKVTPTLLNLNAPDGATYTGPTGEFFATSLMVDTIGAAQAFYATHPNQDNYDFIYLLTDFNFDLGSAFAFYLPLRNDATGIGEQPGESAEAISTGSQRIQGILNLSNISSSYPASPTTRFLGANHALSIMGQEQGHRWLSYVAFPGSPLLLLGRDDAHWSFFMNIESTISSAAAPRSSSAEGNVWRDNGNGTFTSTNLVDGYSRLDQYLMGLRPASEVPDTFVISNPSGSGRTRNSNPAPNVTTSGTRTNVSVSQIIQANGARTPDSSTSRKAFRAAVVLLLQPGTTASQATFNKVARYRLAWESYFAQSTDFLASINTGLAEQSVSRIIAPASAASFKSTLTPGEITALFGAGLTNTTASATTQPLPTTLGGVEVRVDNIPAPLFFVSPNQINFQVPRGTLATTTNPSVQSSTALVEIFSNGQLIRAGAFQLAPAVPGVFTTTQNGRGAAAAVDGITGALAPFNAKQSNGQPNILAIFGSGLGADGTDVDGNVSGVQATIDGAQVTVNYAGRAPGFTGLNQFNIVLPASITSGPHTLVISRNGIPSQEVTIAIR